MTEPDETTREKTLRGLGVSPGYAIGRAHLIDRRQVKVPRYHLSEGEIEAEFERFDAALIASEAQIRQIKSRLHQVGEEHYLILDAHQLMLRDEMLTEGTRQIIREQRINAEWALKKVLRSIKQIFDNIDDEYFRERRSDVDFVGDRLMRNLLGSEVTSLGDAANGAVIVAHDLSPADTAHLMRSAVLGFVTEAGGRTSHTAIMARSLEIPAVVAVDHLTDQIGSGDTLIVDGTSGLVLVNPPPDQIALYQHKQMVYTAQRARLDRVRHEGTSTRDGAKVTVLGNIEQPEEARIVLDHGAEGVGLYRTEYLYMNRPTLPDEEEQFTHYRAVVEHGGAKGAIIRTLDLGGDKLADSVRVRGEENPVMGLRAIRLCLAQPGLFKVQLRALLRASAFGRLKIMLPLVSRLEEVRTARALLAECRAELAAEGHAMADDIPFGIMIEVPAAVVIADLLAREVDFFSIGTNDLAQYTLAVDRGNRHVADLYDPFHPAMLRFLTNIIDAANVAGIEVSMCGEMAGEPLALPVLLGMGLRSFSMNASSIPLIKSMIRDLAISDCRALVDEVRVLDTAAAINARVRAGLRSLTDGALAASMLDPMLRTSGEA
ncbi:MAG: phosphoenolpyruvate--protein phosphotransferase [Myxococcales bacterium]|nr:phosphoenolpyruvate--protein phosphotransferase [Myxococcales bacterium]